MEKGYSLVYILLVHETNLCIYNGQCGGVGEVFTLPFPIVMKRQGTMEKWYVIVMHGCKGLAWHGSILRDMMSVSHELRGNK